MGRAGRLPARLTVAIIKPDMREFKVEAHTAAEAAATDGVVIHGISSRFRFYFARAGALARSLAEKMGSR